MGDNAIFLNITLDVCMKDMLCRSFKLIGNQIRNRPSLYSYIMKYKGASPSKHQSYESERNINYIKCFETFALYQKVNPQHARRAMLKKIEYEKNSVKSHNVNPNMAETIKRLRRRTGMLRKDQMDLLHNYDENLVNKILFNSSPPSSAFE